MRIKKVSQVAGLIDAVETGSNANGNWIKYSDGTMICYKEVFAQNVVITTAWGSLYEGQFALGDWPQTFIEKPNVQVTNASGAGFFIESFTSEVGLTTIGTLLVARATSATTNCRVNILGIGKWK